jgi:hypothetical protein
VVYFGSTATEQDDFISSELILNQGIFKMETFNTEVMGLKWKIKQTERASLQ